MLSYRHLRFSQSARRAFSSTTHAHISSLTPGPAPPPLPKAEQELYEKLQRSSTGAFSSPNPNLSSTEPREPASSSSTPLRINQPSTQRDVESPTTEVPLSNAKVQATGKGEELHPDVRRGARPEFEGDKNPKTGEVGGPKNEPLRWGGEADWSYNGRVTDF